MFGGHHGGQFAELAACVEVGRVGEDMKHGGHPVGEVLVFPDAVECAVGVVVEGGSVV